MFGLGKVGDIDLNVVAPTFYEMIMNERLWVHRRVEHIEVVNREQSRHSLTIDFTVPSDMIGSLAYGKRQCLVPICFLPKHRLQGFSLRQDNAAIPLLARAENEKLKSAILQFAAIQALGFQPGTSLEHATVEFLDAAASVRFNEDEPPILGHRLEQPTPQLEAVLKGADVGWLVEKFWNEFPLSVMVDRTEDRQIVKVNLDKQLPRYDWGSETVRSRALGEAIPYVFPVTHSTFGAPYHVELQLPTDVVAEEASLLAVDVFDLEEPEVYDRAERQETVALYASMLDDTKWNVLYVELKANRSGIPMIAALVSFVNLLVFSLAFFLLAYYESDRSGGQSSTRGQGASVLAVTALIAGALTARDHPLLYMIYAAPRRAMLGLLVVSIALATLVGFAPDPIGPLELSGWAVSIGLAFISTVLMFNYVRNCIPVSRREAE